jgi:hypothetical protein
VYKKIPIVTDIFSRKSKSKEKTMKTNLDGDFCPDRNRYSFYPMGIFEDYTGPDKEELPRLENATEDDLRSVGMWVDE